MVAAAKVYVGVLVVAFCAFMLGLTVGRGETEGLAIVGPILGLVFALNLTIDAVTEVWAEGRA